MPKILAQGSSTYISRRRWTPKDAKNALAALARSELPVAEFAARKGLDAHRLLRWRKRFATDAESVAPDIEHAPDAITFEEIIPPELPRRAGVVRDSPPDAGQGPIEIVLHSGHVIRVLESFNAHTLRRLLNVLAEVGQC